MTETFDLDWADCEPDWDDDEDQPFRLPPDLRGQHITAAQFFTLTDIHPAGSYL
jgi:hypothetical protein